MNYKTILIDGPWLAYRCNSAFQLKTSTGKESQLIHCGLRTLYSIFEQFNKPKMIVCWSGALNWRRQIESTYKPYKSPLSSSFKEQMQDFKILLQSLGMIQYYSQEHEADDVIAHLACDSFHLPKPILIYSIDKDFHQLVDKFTHQYDGKNIIEKSNVIEKFGVIPKHIPYYLSLVGDLADGIIGISGIGPKTAVRIISGYNGDRDFDFYLDFSMGLSPNQIKRFKTNLKLIKLPCELTPDLKSFNIDKSASLSYLLKKYELNQIETELPKYKEMGA